MEEIRGINRVSDDSFGRRVDGGSPYCFRCLECEVNESGKLVGSPLSDTSKGENYIKGPLHISVNQDK